MIFSEHVARIFDIGLACGLTKEIYYGSTKLICAFSGQQNLGNVSSGQASFANISIKKADIPNPQYGDYVTIDGLEWKVIKIFGHDEYVVNLEIRQEARGKIGK